MGVEDEEGALLEEAQFGEEAMGVSCNATTR
jgi:hypothetical protein